VWCLADERVVELLEELVKLQKANEGYFIYTSTSEEAAVEDMLKEFAVKYHKRNTLLADLTEYMLIGREDAINAIRDRILSTGMKAYFTRQRLPISGSVGTITAVVDKSYTYAYDLATGEWRAVSGDTEGRLRVIGEECKLYAVKPDNTYGPLKATSGQLLWVFAQLAAKNSATGSVESINHTNNAAWMLIKGDDSKPGTLVSGSITPGTSSTQLSANADKAAKLVLQAAAANTGTIRVGASGNESIELAAGDRLELEHVNVNEVYAVGNGADTLNYAYTKEV